MRNFGFAKMDTVISIGTNGKMSEISAAMGLTSLESLDSFIEVNKNNYLAYAKGLDGIPGLSLIRYDEKEKNSFQYIVIEVDEQFIGFNRDMLVDILHAENIRVRRYFYPGCHQMEPYRSYFPNAGLVLQHTEDLTLKVLQLPTGTAVGKDEINQICELIRFIAKNAPEIRKRMKLE
jgi:dTDP-4-amino-4,6-dideoxygalactose transaminase